MMYTNARVDIMEVESITTKPDETENNGDVDLQRGSQWESTKLGYWSLVLARYLLGELVRKDYDSSWSFLHESDETEKPFD